MSVETGQWYGDQRRYPRTFRQGCIRALKWALLSYAFVRIYLHLYGAHPAIVPRLGTTLAVLCAVGAGVFAVFAVLSVLVEGVSTLWRYCHQRLEGWRHR